MATYSQRHYGQATYRLANPRVIVEHYTETSTAQAAYNTFAPDTPDPELQELPNVCAHFLVDKDGTIYQLVPLSIMCRHTVARNVKESYDNAGDGNITVFAHSPVTGKNYSMTCRQGTSEDVCTGGNNASVHLRRETTSSTCEPGYSPCLPVTDDLNCDDVPADQKPVKVTGSDRYGLDRDGDGMGCEP
jgi:hypothetical protein